MTDADRVRLLLVEDNPGDVRLLREGFGRGPIESDLVVAENGREALDHLQPNGGDRPRPDIVLLDLNLPGMGGEEVLSAIKSDPDLRRTPVVVLTGSSDDRDVAASYERHANAYLRKPADPEELASLVRTFEAFWFELARLPPGGERG